MTDKVTSVKTVRDLLAREHCAPRKSLGQNFLIDENIIRKIADAGDLGPEDFVLEIGPGLGALTRFLTGQAGKVTAVEYDRGLFTILQNQFQDHPNLILINRDILKCDLKQLISEDAGPLKRFKVMANLPYYITTPIIFQLLESGIPWTSMVFLVQKEVAQRVSAKPGNKEYGALTVMLNYFGRVETVGIVPKTVFYPAPQVDSAIIRITPYPDRFNPDFYPVLQKVVQAAFGQRRKTLANAFQALESSFGNKEKLLAFLNDIGIDPGRRGETLTVDEYLKIAAGILAG